jgi:hypothetical protein
MMLTTSKTLITATPTISATADLQIIQKHNNFTVPDTCKRSWGNILLSGKYDTDQESLDEAENIGKCLNLLILPSKHLLFAKDYIGMAFTSGQTFLHMTAAGYVV